MTDIGLHFEGPFTFTHGERSLFHSQQANLPGIYLWTFKQERDGSHLIHYVGETVSFAKRHREHLVHVLSLNYGLFDPDHAKQGVSTLIWPGLWRDRSADGPSRLLTRYPELTKVIPQYVGALTVFFAELDTDTLLRRHIEGAIAWNLRKKHPEAKCLYPDDNHVGTSKILHKARLLISASEPIQGLDAEIQI